MDADFPFHTIKNRNRADKGSGKQEASDKAVNAEEKKKVRLAGYRIYERIFDYLVTSQEAESAKVDYDKLPVFMVCKVPSNSPLNMTTYSL